MYEASRRAWAHHVGLPRHTSSRCGPACFDCAPTSYLGAVLGLRWAERHGADEGLFVAPEDSYLEGTATALLAWNGGRLAWPASGTLSSVTGAAFARFLGVEGARRPLARADLLAGAVVVGALTCAAPIAAV